jgi:hypothetical protein
MARGGVKMLHPDRRAAAFRGLIGADQEMNDFEVLDAGLAFYRGIFRQGDGNTAFSAMNDAVAHKGKPFHMWSAEEAFESGWAITLPALRNSGGTSSSSTSSLRTKSASTM